MCASELLACGAVVVETRIAEQALLPDAESGVLAPAVPAARQDTRHQGDDGQHDPQI